MGIGRWAALAGIVLLSLSATFAADEVFSREKLERMAGQMIMVGFRGTGEEEPPTPDMKAILEDIDRGRVGGVILFEPDYTTKKLRNIRTPEQVYRLTRTLQQMSSVHLFVGVDQEGGRVRRFTAAHGFPETPGAKVLGAGDPAQTYAEAKALGAKLASVGVNLDFAPVADVDVNPDSPAIGAGGRAFSSSPEEVSRHARAFAEGLWSEKVFFCYKHFPGHGSATTDSHHGFTDISKTWSEAELEPYRDMPKADHFVVPSPGMIMLGHLALDRFDTEHPASLSRAIVTGLLREKLGWNGVVITDDMQMGAIRDNYSEKEAIALAVNAGVDILLFGGNLHPDPHLARRLHGLLVELVEEGYISENRIFQSYLRIINLKSLLHENKSYGRYITWTRNPVPRKPQIY